MTLAARIYKAVRKQEPPYYYNYSLLTILCKPIRKWVTNVVAANCPFNCIRIFLYRLCGFRIGKGTFIGMRCYLDDMCCDLLQIGAHCTASYGVYFACHGRNQGHVPIVLEDYAYIGMRASVISKGPEGEGVTIGEHAVVGACALVNRNVPPYATAVGVPCRIVKEERADD